MKNIGNLLNFSETEISQLHPLSRERYESVSKYNYVLVASYYLNVYLINYRRLVINK